MYYIIDKSALLEKVKEEVSKVADDAYTDDGVSLYDAIIITEKDVDQVNRYLDDAIDLLVRRAFDITKYAPLVDADTHAVTPRLLFYVPDFDTTMEDSVKDELDKYLTLSACIALFQSRRAAVLPEFQTRAQAAMDNVVVLLKSRKSPTDIW